MACLLPYRGQIKPGVVYALPDEVAHYLRKQDFARGPAIGRPVANFTGDPNQDPENYAGEMILKPVAIYDAPQGTTCLAPTGLELFNDHEPGKYIVEWDGEQIVAVGKKLGGKRKISVEV